MGNNTGKKQYTDPYQRNLDELFIAVSNKKGHIVRSDLKKAWASQIDPQLYDNLESYLFLSGHNELNSQTFKKFFADVCKGDSDQKAEVVSKILGGKEEISGPMLLQFIKSILNSILIILESKAPKRFNTWNSRITQAERSESLDEYGMFFLNQISKTENDQFTKEDLLSLLTQFDLFLHTVVCRIYDTEDKHFYSRLIPKWKYTSVDNGKNLEEISVLDLFKIMFLNLELPIDFQNEWRILFSTDVHGESFSRLTAEITNKGPTIIVIRDKDGHIFGGFAPCSWTLGSTFYGDSRSFLFTLHPKMNLYVATNFNENYQYMNVGQQTMPNGLGMGGRLEYFGMWLNAEFGNGYCSESCTTYRNYKMMSAKKEFELSHLEVWGIGPPPASAAELGERSVLDGNLEAKAILEMAGKTAYSDGLREDVDI